MPFLRKYAIGTGADIYIPLIKRAVVDFAIGADFTPAAGDVKISIDGGAAASIGTLPVAVAMGNTAYWKFVFTNAELTGKSMIVTVGDAATKAVEDQAFVIETYGNASAMHPFDLGTASTAQTGDSFARLGAPAGASIAADLVVIDNLVDDLESRCTEARLAELDAANLPADIDQIKADLPTRVTKNTALANFPFVMIDSTDHVSGKTGLTVTAQRSIDGAAFANTANAVTEVANGAYEIDLAAADLNGNTIMLKFTATGADTTFITIVTQP